MKVFDTFTGIGGFTQAYHKLGWETIGFSEIEPNPIAILKYHYPNIKNYGDITKIDAHTLPDFQILIGGFPCFVGDTLIKTDRGYKEIKDIIPGDMVLTHNRRYQKVLNLQINKAKEIYEVLTYGCPITKTTANHPFWVKKMSRVWDKDERRYKRIFSEPMWVEAKHLCRGDYCAYTSITKGIDKNVFSNEPNFWYFVGRFIADGWVARYKRKGRKNSYTHNVIVCCGKHEYDVLNDIMKKLQYNYCVSEERTSYRFIISDMKLQNYLLQWGHRAYNKILHEDIWLLDYNCKLAFLEGYMSGDGFYEKKHKYYGATTTSKKLALGLSTLIAEIYNVPTSLTETTPPSKCVIEGRTVNQRDTYIIRFRRNNSKQMHAFFKDGYIWGPINKVSVNKCDTIVYNLEVEEDNTYTANNIIVHNCQAFSLAGQRKGFEDHRGILWEELARILYVKKPKYFLFENVVGLINHNEGKSIEAILKGFCSCGYVIDWEVYNAMYYGVAQSRSRIIIWGIREDLFDKDNITGGIHGCSRGLEEKINQQSGNQISLFTQRTKAELYGEIKRYIGRECGQEILLEREDNGEVVGFEKQNGQKSVNVGFIDGITDNKKDIANCLHARDYKGISKQQQMTCVEVGINYEQYDVSGKGHKSQQDRVYNVEGVMGTLAAHRGDNKTLIDATGIASRGRGNGWEQKLEEREDEVSNCLTGVAKDSYVAVRMVRTDEAKQLRKENMQNGKDYTPFAMKQLETREDEIMNTLTCASNKDNLLMAERKIRRLTPTEAETLMGWEPGWTAKGIFLDKNGNEVVKDISDSARYKACGNGVVSTMVYDICKVIDEFDKNITSKGIDKK